MAYAMAEWLMRSEEYPVNLENLQRLINKHWMRPFPDLPRELLDYPWEEGTEEHRMLKEAVSKTLDEMFEEWPDSLRLEYHLSQPGPFDNIWYDIQERIEPTDR